MCKTIRINKYLSEAGFCSRREADRLLLEGCVTSNGKILSPGDQISENQQVLVRGIPVQKESRRVLLLFYKPRGIVCSTKKQRSETTVTEYLDYPIRIYPVGRLDKESEGLLLLTNQGDLADEILRARNCHEKEYQVTIDQPVTDAFLARMRAGVSILDTVTRPCIVERTGKNSFCIILTQGLNRQIRRMCETLGCRVLSLKRTRILNLHLQGLAPGQYREADRQEIEQLQALLHAGASPSQNTGGHHGKFSAPNKGTDRAAESGSQGILSGKSGDHKQPGVRPALRRAGNAGEKNRNRTRKQSNRPGRIRSR